jgi:hypothetical protein
MMIYLHHCCSHGTPSWFPSIFTPGQFRRKNVASSQDVICEQYVRPSHLKDAGCAGVAAGGDWKEAAVYRLALSGHGIAAQAALRMA